MKILVTGARGMLGKRVVQKATLRGYDVLAVGHEQLPIDSAFRTLQVISAYQPDVLINCAGALPDRSKKELILTNALGPHILHTHLPRRARMIHMSTDCVFNGYTIPSTYRYTRHDIPNAKEPYGQTKLLGEVAAENVLNVRGSFIAPEHGFLRWLLDAKRGVELWRNAHWTGTSADEMALQLVTLAESRESGYTLHVASPDVWSKADMGKYLIDNLGLDLEIQFVDNPLTNRALYPDIRTMSIAEMLSGLVGELKAKQHLREVSNA